MPGPGEKTTIKTVSTVDEMLVTLKYITGEQQTAALKQRDAEVKAGKKERPIGEILKEQTAKSKNPITKKELDYCDKIDPIARKAYWDEIPEAGDPNPKPRRSLDQIVKDVAKDLKIPEGKAVEPTTKKDPGKRVEGGIGWDPENLLSKAANPSREADRPIERIDRQG